MTNVIGLHEHEPEEPHDGSARIERWQTAYAAWVWAGTYLDVGNAKQKLAVLRKDYPLERYRLTPPGSKGYAENGRRIEDTESGAAA